VDIILNLKQLRLRVDSDEPQVIILDAKGEKTAKAGDFKCPTGVEVINKDLTIAELVGGGKLLLEATVERGRGYLPTEMRKDEKLPIGVIAIDAAFSPVKRVNFNTENTRVGKMTNFDRLIIEIETDGSITPQAALEQSSAILVDHFSVIAGAQAEPTADETVETEVETAEEIVTEEAKPKKSAAKTAAKKTTKKAAK
jgi:DNA-directed RNA polymerase subunit alpha